MIFWAVPWPAVISIWKAPPAALSLCTDTPRPEHRGGNRPSASRDWHCSSAFWIPSPSSGFHPSLLILSLRSGLHPSWIPIPPFWIPSLPSGFLPPLLHSILQEHCRTSPWLGALSCSGHAIPSALSWEGPWDSSPPIPPPLAQEFPVQVSANLKNLPTSS